jgi:hypothetical protein
MWFKIGGKYNDIVMLNLLTKSVLESDAVTDFIINSRGFPAIRSDWYFDSLNLSLAILNSYLMLSLHN